MRFAGQAFAPESGGGRTRRRFRLNRLPCETVSMVWPPGCTPGGHSVRRARASGCSSMAGRLAAVRQAPRIAAAGQSGANARAPRGGQAGVAQWRDGGATARQAPCIAAAGRAAGCNCTARGQVGVAQWRDGGTTVRRVPRIASAGRSGANAHVPRGGLPTHHPFCLTHA